VDGVAVGKGDFMASLLVLKGNNQGQRVPLSTDKSVLGRNPDCQVVISGTAVSREHAQIVYVQGKFYIEDKQSRNGTFVNNQQISGRTLLHEGDRIKICDALFTFHDVGPAKPPLPSEPADEPEPDDSESSSTVEAMVSGVGSNLLLEAQPSEKLAALLEISTDLRNTLELDPLLPKIVDSLFQLFRQADRGFIILREEGSGRLIPKVIKTRRANAESNARFSRSIVKQCLETVQAFLIDDAATDSRFGLSQSVADFRIRSVMCAPLCTADGKAFGVIQVDTQDRSKKFVQDDLSFLVGVSNQAAIVLENAKLYQDLLARERLKRDVELARQVQLGFLPARLPEVPGYQFFADYESAQEVGGDYYDFIPLGQRLAVAVGDVAGKGVPAALLMAKVSSDVRFCLLTEDDPAKAISKLNSALQKTGMMDRFVTFAVAILDPQAHTVTLVNAGHISPLLYRRATGELEEATPNDLSGLPLGVVDQYDYVKCQVQLQPGDCVLIFTDGVTEAMDLRNVQFQMRGITNALHGGPYPAQAVGERIVRAVKQHASGRSQHDDITLVTFGRGDV
jgi:serine phosphatase RsbU (regulator of sigma subunit)/pSer/pThr/pTyr-binding forkhead associated (FHA) protein